MGVALKRDWRYWNKITLLSQSCDFESCGSLGPLQNSVFKCGSGCGWVLNSEMPKQISDWNFYRQPLKRRQKIKCFKCRDLSLSVTGVPHVPKPNTEHSWVPVCCAVHEEQLCLLDGHEKLWNEEYDKGGTQCLKSRMLLIPAAAQLQIAKSTRCWPRAGKLHGSRSSGGIWLRFCREKHERKIKWNKMILGMWSGWSGWRRRQESSEQALIWNKQWTMNKKKTVKIPEVSLHYNFISSLFGGGVQTKTRVSESCSLCACVRLSMSCRHKVWNLWSECAVSLHQQVLTVKQATSWIMKSNFQNLGLIFSLFLNIELK